MRMKVFQQYRNREECRGHAGMAPMPKACHSMIHLRIQCHAMWLAGEQHWSEPFIVPQLGDAGQINYFNSDPRFVDRQLLYLI